MRVYSEACVKSKNTFRLRSCVVRMFTALIISERRRVSFSLSLLSLYALLHTVLCKMYCQCWEINFQCNFWEIYWERKMRDFFSQGCDIQSTLLGCKVIFFCCKVWKSLKLKYFIKFLNFDFCCLYRRLSKIDEKFHRIVI
jgi:hypothetical protein